MKVWPTNTDARKHLRHPTGGAFRAEGHMDWPDDSFTARRIADGDVTVVDPTPQMSVVSPMPPESTTDKYLFGEKGVVEVPKEYVDHTKPPVKKPEPKKSKGE